MARTPRPTGTRFRPPETPVREAFFTDETNWRDYRSRWAEIDQTLPLLVDVASIDVMARLRAAARENLRREVRAAATVGPRSYLVPV